VFADLSRAVGQLKPGTVLPAWLYEVTRRTSVDVIRGNSRRQVRERIAAELMDINSTSAQWNDIEPLLDEAMEPLDERDREVVLLRYFANQSLREVGVALGTSENAAQKRVARAVDCLREFFARRGVTVGASGLVLLISSKAVSAAPSALVASVAAKVLAIAGGSTATAVAVTKTITMTTLQKTVIGAVMVVAVGAGIYEARQASQLRAKVRSLEEQQAAARSPSAQTDAAPREIAAVQPSASFASPINPVTDWASRLMALNTNDWRTAFALGQKLAELPPDESLAVLRQNWSSVTNTSARQQLLKAFDFANHQHFPAVLELAYLDPSHEVQNWAITYLRQVALQDFSSNYNAGAAWLAARRDQPLSVVFADSVAQAAQDLRGTDTSQIETRLRLFKEAHALFRTFPDATRAAGLNEALGYLASGGDTTAELALETVASMSVDDDWARQVALPQLQSTNSWNIRASAADILGAPGREWALQPLLDTLTAGVYSEDRQRLSSFAQSVSAIGSARAIPPMVALIDADNSYDTVYGIGYFGLSKITGVSYDEKHNGSWWRQWWAENKQRFPADVQAMEPPQLEPVKKAGK
jgi:RNA polymerase sigma factor (sigma-70 family)